MFEIEGIFAEKFYPDGQISRLKRTFKMQLNTEHGVMAFIEEQKPFYQIAIRDLTINEDKTEYFLGTK
jgi:hypothetical protein